MSYKLFTGKQHKTMKSTGRGYLPLILHLRPSKFGTHNSCSHATAGCIKSCYANHGRLNMPVQKAAAVRRTNLFYDNRQAFIYLLKEDIETGIRRATKAGLKLCIRLNGTSDIPWEKIDRSIFTDYPAVWFYDYTKVPSRFKKQLPANYDLTFSMNDVNQDAAEALLRQGHNVAVVFRRKTHPFPVTESLPRKYKGHTVINGENHDLRFLDRKGVVVGLRSKGKAYYDETGFVQE